MTTTSPHPSPTPAEADLPRIISVDDHILEPRDLWQRELPASWRARGPRVSRERVTLSFSGGHYGFERGTPDGQWCDVWLYDDLAMPTGRLHAPVGLGLHLRPGVGVDRRDQGTGAVVGHQASVDGSLCSK